ncbi:hypothetical protein ACJOT4_29450, partial [Nocardiopsis sp. frass4]
MSIEPLSSEVRAVLGAPRGHRFSRPAAPALSTREQRLLAQMPDNPRIAYRQVHGQTPPWMEAHAARLTQGDTPRPARRREPAPAPAPERAPARRVPRPRPDPDDGPVHPRPRPEPPPLPRRPRRPHSHRKPRHHRRTAWRLTAYTLAALAGALAHHLAAP